MRGVLRERKGGPGGLGGLGGTARPAAVAALLAGLVFAAGGRAHALPLDLSLRGGAVVPVTALDRVTPAMELEAALRLPADRLRLFFAVGGWTLPGGSSQGAASELAATAGARYGVPLGGRFSLSLSAGAAAQVAESAGGWGFRPALLLAPSVEMATRRRSLVAEVGVRSWLGEQSRVAAVAGIGYRF